MKEVGFIKKDQFKSELTTVHGEAKKHWGQFTDIF
jgi:uncharacterized protein YjbJ (UPF0337 family)